MFIKYKLNSVSEQYKHLYRFGIDNVNDSISEFFMTGKFPAFETNTSTYQSFNSVVHTKSTDSFNYNEKLNFKTDAINSSIEAMGNAMAFLLTEDEYNIENHSSYHNFIFHNSDN